MTIDERWALITGACGGIGTALVEVFQRNGYRVIGTDRHATEHPQRTMTHYLQLDLNEIVSSAEYTVTACTEIHRLTEGKGISALVNNAAVQNLASLGTIDRQSWQESLDVNLSAPLFLTQGLSESLIQNRGSVVNISSIHANQTKPGFFAYATSKAGLSVLTRSLAVEVGARIRINAIEPAAVGTQMLKEGFKERPDKLDLLHTYHPVGRIAEPVEVAELALFLCSEKARFIHGECISLSGGIDRRLYDPE